MLNSSLEGRPTTLGCDSATGVCSVAIEGFFIQTIPADCETAECLVEGYSLETGAPARLPALHLLALPQAAAATVLAGQLAAGWRHCCRC